MFSHGVCIVSSPSLTCQASTEGSDPSVEARFFRIEFSFSCFYKHPHTLSANFSDLLQIYSPLSPHSTSIAAVSAFAVESANIVGYQNVNGAASQKAMIGATFQKIAGTGMTLGDVGVNDSFVELSDMLTLLNEYGGAAGVYVYMTATTAADFGLEAGWYDNDEISTWDGESPLINKNSVELYDGEAMMLQVSSSDAALVFAGAVPDEAVELECAAGQKTFLSNCTPVDRTLGDITVNASFAELADMLTILNEYGGAAGVYVYMTATTAADFGLEAGWYDNDEISTWDGESPLLPQAIALPAGKGFMLQVAADGAAVIVPAAL